MGSTLFPVYTSPPGIGHTYRTPAPLTLYCNPPISGGTASTFDRYSYTGRRRGLHAFRWFISLLRHLISRLSHCVITTASHHMLSNAFSHRHFLFPPVSLSTRYPATAGTCTKGRRRRLAPHHPTHAPRPPPPLMREHISHSPPTPNWANYSWVAVVFLYSWDFTSFYCVPFFL